MIGKKATLSLFNALILLIPIFFLCIPLFLGYNWNIMGYGVGDHNIYNRPEGYNGRYPDGYLSIEAMTPMIYNVPYDVTLRRYIFNGQLPLWNTNKGIGTPFAAQGEGSPYFPLAVIRSLLPYNYWNYVTFLGFFLAAIFLFLFLREMAVSEYVAYIGSYSFVLSGALSGQIIATNITSSLIVTPLLFWVSAKAIKLQTSFWRSLFSIAVALQILAGHIQMSFVILLSLVIFCLYFTWLKETQFSDRLKEFIIIMVYLVLGVGLVAFLLFPIIECLNVAYHNKEIRDVHSLPISWLLAFIYPLIFGLFRENWFHVNWFDLFAYTGQAIIVAVIGGVALCWNNRFHRSMFWLFIAFAMFWIFRYTGFPLLIWIWKLPFFAQLSPKHTNGFIVFCLSIAAAFAIEHINKWQIFRFITILLIAFAISAFVFILTVVNTESHAILQSIGPYLIISIILSLFTLAIFIYVKQLSNIPLKKARLFLLTAIASELIFYIPLGNNSWRFLLLRFGVYILTMFVAILFIRRRVVSWFLISRYFYEIPLFYKIFKHYRYLLVFMVIITVAVFVVLIRFPQYGLPNQFDVTVPPKHIFWLKERLTQEERVFGIRPDYQTLADIESIDTNGPFQPYGFVNFIKLIEGNITPSEKGFFNNGYFDIILTQYNMSKYILHKPFFDWVGVRYIVLEKSVFDKRKEEYNALVDNKSGLKVAYKDNSVTILESSSPLSRAYFSSNYKSYSNEAVSTEAIIQFFKNHQSDIAQMTLLEEPALNNLGNSVAIELTSASAQIPLNVENHEPNYIQLKVNAPSSGIVVLKDAFYPGWRGYINNKEAPILRANGMVRAVIIDRPGKYVVEFKYLPSSFLYGVMLSAIILVFLISNIALSYRISKT